MEAEAQEAALPPGCDQWAAHSPQDSVVHEGSAHVQPLLFDL